MYFLSFLGYGIWYVLKDRVGTLHIICLVLKEAFENQQVCVRPLCKLERLLMLRFVQDHSTGFYNIFFESKS